MKHYSLAYMRAVERRADERRIWLLFLTLMGVMVAGLVLKAMIFGN